MGILNVTPDSFSDGGAFLNPAEAVYRAMTMIAEGADLIDIGPESTRPGSRPVEADEQTRRAIPVIRAIRERDPSIPISIDTRLASVSEAAIDAGADLINDTSALRDDPALSKFVADAKVPIVLMHRRGDPLTMQAGDGPHYENLIANIQDFFRERIDFTMSHGIACDRIILDPGIGFGKRFEHNVEIIARLREFTSMGQPVLFGASRKRFLGELVAQHTPAARQDPSLRINASIACAVLAAIAGAAIVRVHDVAATVEAITVARATMPFTQST